jgi:hypothetical protein
VRADVDLLRATAVHSKRATARVAFRKRVDRDLGILAIDAH